MSQTLQGQAGDRTSFLLDLFARFDEDDSGQIEVEELGQLMASLGLHADKSVIQCILDEIDTDKSGTIDKDEFVEFMSQINDLKDLQKTLAFEADKHSKTKTLGVCYFAANFVMFFVFLCVHFSPESTAPKDQNQPEEESTLSSLSQIGVIVTGATFGLGVFFVLIVPLGRLWAQRIYHARDEKRKATAVANEVQEEPPQPHPRASFGGRGSMRGSIIHDPLPRPANPELDDIPQPPEEPPPVWQSYRRPKPTGAVAPYDEEAPSLPPPPGFNDTGSHRRSSNAGRMQRSSSKISRASYDSRSSFGSQPSQPSPGQLGMVQTPHLDVAKVGYYAPSNYEAAREMSEAAVDTDRSFFNPYLAKREGIPRPQSAPAGRTSTQSRPQSAPLALTNGRSSTSITYAQQRPQSAAALTNGRYR